MRLPADVSRCIGVGNDAEGWREGCEDCLRRTDIIGNVPGLQWISYMQPPPIIAFECEYRIAPDK